MNRRRLLGVFAATCLTAAALMGPAYATDHQIRICHALGNGGYTAPIPTKQQIFDPDGHGSFVAGVHPDDIIPPFDAGSQGNNSWDAYPGKNWTTAGIAIWERDCQSSDATTTTTEEQASTTTTTFSSSTTVETSTTTSVARSSTTTIPTTTSTDSSTTSSTISETSTSTTPRVATTAPGGPTTDNTLPYTGPGGLPMTQLVLAGLGLLAAGGALIRREEP